MLDLGLLEMVALAWIGWDLSLKEKVFGMLDIVQITDKKEILALGPIFREYVEDLGKDDEDYGLLVSAFTKFRNPGTLLLVAIKDDEPVGFLWAQPVSEFNEKYLMILDIYAKHGMMGTNMFKRAIEWARENDLSAVKGFVRAKKAKAMKRLFKMEEEMVFISMEV